LLYINLYLLNQLKSIGHSLLITIESVKINRPYIKTNNIKMYSIYIHSAFALGHSTNAIYQAINYDNKISLAI